MNYYLIGYIGLANNLIVSIITIWRTLRWYFTWDNPETWANYTFKKKLLFHVLLMCTAFSDIPLYFGFIVTGGYTISTYSFHKLASTFLFAALSITIGDWASVLRDINEYAVHGFIFRRATLISLNLVYITISVINFILCLALKNLDEYLNSPMYTCAIFLQIIMNFLLTTMMLHAGLKLYSRIHGAVGNMDHHHHHSNHGNARDNEKHRSGIAGMFRISDSLQSISHISNNNNNYNNTTNNPLNQNNAITPTVSDSFSQSMDLANTSPLPNTTLFTPTTTSTASVNNSNRMAAHSKSTTSQSRSSVAAVDGNMELKNALNNLNFVMATCTVCILLQMIMLTLNYALGYADQANKTVGPPFFYWTCSYYVPLWGPILALLYLSRSQSHRKRAKFLSMHRHSEDDGLEGSRTSFSPHKLPPTQRPPNQLRQFSNDTDDLEAYLAEQHQMMLQSPLMDGATITEYSAGHQGSHNLLYANHLLAASQNHPHASTTSSSNSTSKRKARGNSHSNSHSTTSRTVVGRRRSRKQSDTTTNTDDTHTIHTNGDTTNTTHTEKNTDSTNNNNNNSRGSGAGRRKKTARQLSMDVARGTSSEIVDVLTHNTRNTQQRQRRNHNNNNNSSSNKTSNSNSNTHNHTSEQQQPQQQLSITSRESNNNNNNLMNSSYSLNPTHVSMSMGLESGQSDGALFSSHNYPHNNNNMNHPNTTNMNAVDEEEEEQDVEYEDEDYEEGEDYDDEGEEYDEDYDGEYSDSTEQHRHYGHHPEHYQRQESSDIMYYERRQGQESTDSVSDANSMTDSYNLDNNPSMMYRDTNMTNVSLPSELIFPHNFNFKPPTNAVPISANNTYNNNNNRTLQQQNYRK